MNRSHWVLVSALLSLAAAAPARAQEYAPADAPGPALSEPRKELEAALRCSKGLDDAKHAPVLLVQGTGATAKDNWSWTYEPALDKLGVPWCQVDIPDHAEGDLQRNGEFVVYAIRTMHARAKRRIAIIGHSQGGMLPRWALRFWPDTRAMVDDMIGFAPSNHGTTQANCSAEEPCSPAGWQQSDGSSFIKAVNSRAETWAGISYTNIYTRTDEVVLPNESSMLHTGAGRITNVATQDICPNDVYEHLLIGLIDPVAYALAVDALEHDGPAQPARVPLTTCAQTLQPGVDPVTGPAAGLAAAISYGTYDAATVTAEPALRCYVTASCAPPCRSRSRVVVHVRALRGATARVGGKPVRVRRRGGRLEIVVSLRRAGSRTVTLVVRGRDRHDRSVRITRRFKTCA